MPPFDLVRSILVRAHVQSPRPYVSTAGLPESGPPIPASRPPDQYDPAAPQYQDATPSYEPPAPWFAGLPIAGTPAVRPTNQLEVETRPEQIHYDDAVMDQQLHNELMQAVVDGFAAEGAFAAVHESVAPDALPDPYSVPEPTQLKPNPAAMIDVVSDLQSQVMPGLAESPAPDQLAPSMPLEQVVEQEFQQMMDPAGMAELPDIMMAPGMPMDPFGPMPPGLGPM